MLHHGIVLFLCLWACALSAHATDALRILSWPGYVSETAIQTFQSRYASNVEVVVIHSDDELWQQANSNPPFDLIALNAAELPRYIDAQLVAPIHTPSIPNTKKQTARFQALHEIKGLTKNGQVYGIPYTYSAMGLIYNRKLVSEPPTSMQALWDPRYYQKVLAFDGSAHNFSLSALILGYENPFNLSSKQFSEVVRHLALLRLNAFKFYSSPEEAVRLYQDHEIALIYANYGDQQITALRNIGADIGYVVPAEGALAWMDCWAVGAQTARSKKRQRLASTWINHMLSATNAQEFSRSQGLPNTLADTKLSSMPDKAKLVWLQPVEDAEKRSEYWVRLLSSVPEKR